jgi:serine/threonine protein kinase
VVPKKTTSLKDILANPPEWWTSTAKALVVTGIVMGLMEIHKSGMVHRNLRPSNVLLDEKHRVQLCDLASGVVRGHRYGAPEGAREEDARSSCDIFSLAVIWYEILVGHSIVSVKMQAQVVTQKLWGKDIVKIPKDWPQFTRTFIEKGWSADPAGRPTIEKVFEGLKENGFKVLDDVESDEVRDFVEWVEERRI